MYLLYSLGLALWLLLSSPYWLFQMARNGKYRAGLAQRLGRVPVKAAFGQRIIWVHAVSVGEVMAVAGVVEELRRDQVCRVVVSTTTDTGQAVAKQRFGDADVFYFPLDFAFAVRAVLRALRPELIVIAETEFWPNFLRLAHAQGARIAIVNARISDRSLPGYRRVRRWLARSLSLVDVFLAQTEEDRRRLLDIGAPASRVSVVGNLKFDMAAPAGSELAERLHREFTRAETFPVLVCGSTVEREERLLCRAFEIVLSRHPRAVMILAPRRPERFERVAGLLRDLCLRFWRRSSWSEDEHFLAGGVFLLDTVGELAPLYSLATLAFVGGSLAPRGGHNILEAARFGVPLLVGPHTENFRDMVNQFRDAGALRVVGPAELPLVFTELIDDPAVRAVMGQRAREVMETGAGATGRTVAALAHLLPGTAVPANVPLPAPVLRGTSE